MASFQILLSLSLSFSRSPAFSSHLSRPSVLSGCPFVFRYNLFFSAFSSVAPFITLRYHLTVDSFYGTTCAGSVFREIADRYRVVRRTDLQISDTSRTLCLSIFLLAFFYRVDFAKARVGRTQYGAIKAQDERAYRRREMFLSLGVWFHVNAYTRVASCQSRFVTLSCCGILRIHVLG